MEKELEVKIQYLKGVGPKLGAKLNKLGIETIRDLIFYWPRRYDDYTTITKIGDLGHGNPKESSDPNYRTIKGRILGISNKLTSRQRMKITEAVVEDGTGTIKLVWFNQPFLKEYLKVGSEWIFHGRLDYDSFNHNFIMESPSRVKVPCIVPIYPLTAGLRSGYLSKLIASLRSKLAQIEESLPDEVIVSGKLMPLSKAVSEIHFPSNFEKLSQARERLAFDELFFISLRSRLAREELKKDNAPKLLIPHDEVAQMISKLPFKLTNDQKKAIDQITEDLGKSKPMNRLLNGDVGSGKTVVAAIAAYVGVRAGYRVVLLAPTEVLATQHFQTFCKLFEDSQISVGLLTSNLKELYGNGSSIDDSDKAISSKVKPESADIVIGTHAILQKGVELENLGLIIVDEQHRFGVKQRGALKNQISIRQPANQNANLECEDRPSKSAKQKNHDLTPHFLSMTATPIPRTLHLALFGDLDVSIISEKPANRKEIKTRFVEPSNRSKAYQFIDLQIRAGRQVFVICPLIEDSSSSDGLGGAEELTLFDLDRKSVAKEFERLSKEIFPMHRVSMLHGKMKPKDKENILSDFNKGKSDILVSTSVIEVGIDIPNASVMMIEDAERFGLAQIHQFRGRVGRGEHQSFCFLFSNTRSEAALHRLRSLEATSDGFKLAEIDLETRGPGDIFGTLQSGQLELKMASFSDRILLERASNSAGQIIEGDPDLKKHPKLYQRLVELESSRHLE